MRRTNPALLKRRIRAFALQAAAGAALAALFAAGLWLWPRFALWMYSRNLREPIGVRSVPSLIERGMQLDRVRTHLNERIGRGDANPNLHAWMGALEARERGPEAGFAYFVELFKQGYDPREEIAVWTEFARQAARLERWDDFFALCMLLSDYGEGDSIRQMLSAERGASQALRSAPGLRFLAYSEWTRGQNVVRLGDAPAEIASWLELWRLEAAWRLDSFRPIPVAEYEALAAARPLDPRARGLLAARQSPEGASASKALQAVEALGLARRLEGRDFLSAGHPFANDTLTTHGMAAARLAQSAQALWLVAQGSPSLGVYPLTFLELDGELSIRYLHGVAAFPEYARRRDGRPFAEVRIWLLNPFADPRLLTRRQLALHGAFDASGYRGWDAP